MQNVSICHDNQLGSNRWPIKSKTASNKVSISQSVLNSKYLYVASKTGEACRKSLSERYRMLTHSLELVTIMIYLIIQQWCDIVLLTVT